MGRRSAALGAFAIALTAAAGASGSAANHGGTPYAVSVVGVDGTGDRVLYGNSRFQGHELSRDRGWFVVSDGNYTTDRLFVTRLGGYGLRRIVTVTGLVQGARWSPDGRRISFSTDDGRSTCRVTAWIVTVRTRELRKLADCAGAPAWAPDSRRVAYVTRDGELRLANAKTGGSAVVARGAWGAGAGASDLASLVAWSPGGLRIAYIGGTPSKLHIVRLRDRKDIAVAPATDTPSWSPDGRRLAFVHAGRLAVIHRDGTHFRVLDRGVDSRVPAWSPKGGWIAYVRYVRRRGSTGAEVHVIAPTGGRPRRLTNRTAIPLDELRYVAFGPVFWSRDSRRVFYLHYVHFGG